MDLLTHCVHCKRRMVAAPSDIGRTGLRYLFCDKLDPMDIGQVGSRTLSKGFPNRRAGGTTRSRRQVVEDHPRARPSTLRVYPLPSTLGWAFYAARIREYRVVRLIYLRVARDRLARPFLSDAP
jgi:hypothetical protein